MSQIVLAAGTVVGGDYRVERLLNSGGMGAVFVVTQISTAAQRALKVMRAELVADPKMRERFVQEARVGATIPSDHVAQVLAAGVDGPTGMPYLIMELLQGEDLGAFIRRTGALGVSQCSAVLEQICHAVGAAHAMGIVHRDLKPENLVVAPSRTAGRTFSVKVLDFGIAKVLADASSAKLTSAMGTPLWMAPEQSARRAIVTPETDVWALGLIAFYCLTGRVYWETGDDEEASAQQVMREILIDEIVAPTVRAAAYGLAVPAWFDAWFARCTTRNPSDRFATASLAYEAFAQAANAHPSAPEIPVPTPMNMAVAVAVRPSKTELVAPLGEALPIAPAHTAIESDAHIPIAPAARGPRRSRAPTIALVGFGALVGIGFAAAFAMNRKEEAEKDKKAAAALAVPPASRTETFRQIELDARIPMGLDPTPAQQLVGSWHYRFVYEANKLVRIEHVRPSGTIATTLGVDESGPGRRIRFIDGYGVQTETRVAMPDGTWTGVQRSGARKIDGCHQLKMTYDERGYATEQRCLAADGTLMRGEKGCAVLRETRDARGHVTAETCAEDGDVDGVHRLVHELDDRGNVVAFRGFDDDDRPTVTTDGCHLERLEVDAAGNVTKRSCFDAAGHPTGAHGYGFVASTFRFGADGCLEQRTLLDANGAPAEAGGVSTMSYRNDAQCGRLHEETRNVAGLLFAGSHDVTPMSDYVRNAQGDVIERRCASAPDVPTGCESGSDPLGSIVRYTRNERGLATDERCFVAADGGTPSACSADSGSHHVHHEYDDEGRSTGASYFDTEGKPALRYGGTRRTLQYDANGNDIEQKWFGPDGKPVMISLGFHELRKTFDAKQRVASVATFGPTGLPTGPQTLSFGAISWYPGAARVVVERSGGAASNVWYAPNGALLKRDDECAKHACFR